MMVSLSMLSSVYVQPSCVAMPTVAPADTRMDSPAATWRAPSPASTSMLPSATISSLCWGWVSALMSVPAASEK